MTNDNDWTGLLREEIAYCKGRIRVMTERLEALEKDLASIELKETYTIPG
jgi:hypothetical protein